MRFRLRVGRGTLREDAVAGLVLGVESVPDGLAAGVLAGVSPLSGLYGYMFGTLGGSFFTGSAFMAVQATGAMAIIIADTPAVHSGPDQERALFTLAMLVGVVMLVFEGRDTAGKGGTIKRITDRVSPRVFHVVALPTPTEREKSQMYMQRYVRHFPAAGEVTIFDRSWYNRAGVERVMGFCTPEETERFLRLAPAYEKAMVESGILLLKYWLEVSADEQARRLMSRIYDPRKIWKLSDMDLKSRSRWYDYSRARDAMFAATDTDWAPWYVANTDNKRRGRLNIITHVLSQVPYTPLTPRDVILPNRQPRRGYREPNLPLRQIPTPF